LVFGDAVDFCFENKKLVKLAVLFVCLFFLVIGLLYFFVFSELSTVQLDGGKLLPVDFKFGDNVYFKASELNQPTLKIVSSENSGIFVSNDLDVQCNLLLFPLVNKGAELAGDLSDFNVSDDYLRRFEGIAPVFSGLIEPGKEVSLAGELVKGQAYALYCGELKSFDFEKSNYSELVFKEPSSEVFVFDILNGRLVLSSEESDEANGDWITISSTQKLWFVVRNRDNTDFSFDLVGRKEEIDEAGIWPFILHEHRGWPYLVQNKTIVLGPFSFKKSFYALGLSNPHCKEKCAMEYQFHIEVQ